MILFKKFNIKAIKIEIMKNWLKPKSVYDINVFLDFANFYEEFIKL